MEDLDTVPEQQRIPQSRPEPEWVSLVWRPAGSQSLADRWLRAGEVKREKPQPPPLPKRTKPAK
ncbi:MAG: hypothetical protein ACOZIN_00195 [Myxococcota bacterium]